MKRGSFSASREQRAKVLDEPCRNCGWREAEAAHATPRSIGGCEDADCVLPLCRQCHRDYDHAKTLDVLPLLTRDEQAHAVSHLGLLGALKRTTNEEWFPYGEGCRMKVLVCGSRDWTDRNAINARIAELPKDSLVIQGGAPGADRMARHAAALVDLHWAEVPALWRTGRGAGPRRNRVMLDLQPDLVLAFQLHGSRGTQDTIDEATRRGIPVEVYRA